MAALNLIALRYIVLLLSHVDTKSPTILPPTPSLKSNFSVVFLREGTSHKSSWYYSRRRAATRVESVVGSVWPEMRRLTPPLIMKVDRDFMLSVLQQVQ